MVSAVGVLGATFLALALLWVVAKVPGNVYRGTVVPYLVLVVTSAVDVATQAYLSKYFAVLLCPKP